MDGQTIVVAVMVLTMFGLGVLFGMAWERDRAYWREKMRRLERGR